MGKPLKPEYLFYSIWEGNSSPTLIALVYRPPDVSIRPDQTFIESLRTYSSDFSHKVIIGDWNANMLDSNNSDTRYLNNLTMDLSLNLVNTGVSHHSDGNDTWTDVNFVDDCDTIISLNRTSPNFVGRHDIISVTIDMFYPEPLDVSIKYKAINSIASHELNSHLRQLDCTAFSSVDEGFDIEQGLSALTENLKSTIEILAPEKTMKLQKTKYPWLNSELRLLRSKREATSRRYQRTGSSKLLGEFLSLANTYEE